MKQSLSSRLTSARPFLYLGLPTLLLIGWIVFPLVRGSDTFYLRDLFSTHLPLKAAQAQAMRHGGLPLLNPYSGGGQPLAGNPNAVAFYPDNLLYLLGEGAGATLWALNAHLWLHWLLAAPAMFWLGRRLGLSRQAAWASGVSWATGGYFLSQLNFYNLIAGVCLTPAFLAAWLALRQTGKRRYLAAVAVLWALLLTSGDPLLAAMALAMAFSISLFGLGTPADITPPKAVSPPATRLANSLRHKGSLLAALTVGTLLAAPQWVEFLRILPGSFRAVYGYSQASSLVASLDPRQLFDLLIPLPFGLPDQLGPHSFWGHRAYSGVLPFYWSLYPGLAVLALFMAGVLRRSNSKSYRQSGVRARRWLFGLLVSGVFVSLGAFNPGVSWIFSLPALRYPIKFWLPAALAMVLLAGVGFEAAIVQREAAARRRFVWTLVVISALLALITTLTLFSSVRVEGWLVEWMGRGAAAAAAERARWARLSLASLAVVVALALTFRWTRSPGSARWPLGAAALLTVHAVTQLFFLRALMATDATLPYTLHPPLLAQTTAEMRLAHGASGRLFGPSSLYRGRFPARGNHWLTRRAFHELYPLGGPLWERSFALNLSPEGLSSFHSTIARQAVATSKDPARLRLLAAWGVDRLLLDRRLAPGTEHLATELASHPSFGHTLTLYGLPGAAPAARLATRAFEVAGPEGALRLLTDPNFDPRHDVVVERQTAGRSDQLGDPPPSEPTAQTGRTLRVVEEGPERFAADVAVPSATVLALRRSFLDLYRVSIDDEPAEPLLINMHQLGVEVPAGNHRVRFWVDRRPFHGSLLLSLLGLLGLIATGWPRRRPRDRSRGVSSW